MSRYVENGKVCREGFINFYLDANCCMPVERDDYFKTMIEATWGLFADKCAVSDSQLAALESVVFEKIR
jgi:urate oxidase